MAKQYGGMITLVLIVLASLAAARTADGEVPTIADFAACNREAPEAVKAGSVLATVGDHVRAEVSAPAPPPRHAPWTLQAKSSSRPIRKSTAWRRKEHETPPIRRPIAVV